MNLEEEIDRLSFDNNTEEIFNNNYFPELLYSNIFQNEKVKDLIYNEKSMSNWSSIKIEKQEKSNTKNNKTSKLRKKRGRKPKIDDENSKKHSNDYRDNIVYKIKSHFHSFIIKYLNVILSIVGVENKSRFSNFCGEFQKDITRKTNSKLLDLPISEILKNIANTKKKKNPFLNKILYERVKDNSTLKPYFSLTYKEFYLKYTSSKPDEVISNNNNIENSEYLKKTYSDKDKLSKVLNTFITNFDSIPKNPKKESEIYKILFDNADKKFI